MGRVRRMCALERIIHTTKIYRPVSRMVIGLQGSTNEDDANLA